MPDAVTPTTPQSVRSSAPRPWISPRLAELPKLTQLTLASAIGGGGGTSGGGSTVFGLLLALGLTIGVGACSGEQTMQGPGVAAAPHSAQIVTCTVRRDDASLTCGGPAGAPGSVTTGSQGQIVGLRSSDVSWDNGTDILSATVTVENLSRQPMGTSDGTTLDGGIDVFFVAGPIGPLGETVDLPNAEGPETFTAAGQLYFHYDEVLQPNASSAGQVWEFDLNGVTDFTFSVLVNTQVPSGGAFLTWWQDPFLGTARWMAVDGWGTNGLAIFGDYGTGAVREGGAWRQRGDPLQASLSTDVYAAVVANGPREIFKVLTDSRTIRYWDGISWRSINTLPGGSGTSYFGVSIASTGPGVLYAARDSVRKFTVGPASGGGTWTTLPDPTGSGFHCQASYATDTRFFCAFGNGAIYSWDGASWSAAGNVGFSPYMIFASDVDDIWVYTNFSYPGQLKHWDGVSWSSPTPPTPLETTYLVGGISLPNGEAYVTITGGGGQIWRWDGSAWQPEYGSGTEYPRGLWARSADTVYAVGLDALVLKRVNGAWTSESGHFGSAGGNNWRSAYVAPDGKMFIGAAGNVLRRWDGTAWVSQPTLNIFSINTLWGSSSSNVYAGGPNNYGLDRFDGASWSEVVGVPDLSAAAIGGTGPNDVWAVGSSPFSDRNIVHFNGTNWTTAATPDPTISLNAVWGVSSNVAIAVGDNGTLLTWNGSVWSSHISGTSSSLRGAWGSSAADLWAVGDDGVILHWDGLSWGPGGSSCAGSAGLRAIWGVSATEIYASSEWGLVCFYNGTSWTALDLPDDESGSLDAIAGDAVAGQLLIAGNRVFRAMR